MIFSLERTSIQLKWAMGGTDRQTVVTVGIDRRRDDRDPSHAAGVRAMRRPPRTLSCRDVPRSSYAARFDSEVQKIACFVLVINGREESNARPFDFIAGRPPSALRHMPVNMRE